LGRGPQFKTAAAFRFRLQRLLLAGLSARLIGPVWTGAVRPLAASEQSAGLFGMAAPPRFTHRSRSVW